MISNVAKTLEENMRVNVPDLGSVMVFRYNNKSPSDKMKMKQIRVHQDVRLVYNT